MTTPAMMFPVISLLLLAYANRYLTLPNRVRNLFDSYQTTAEENVFLQITSLRYGLTLIRKMQVSGVSSLLFCVVVVFFVFVGFPIMANIIFAIILLLMMVSLVISVIELNASNEALNILLSKMEDYRKLRNES